MAKRNVIIIGTAYPFRGGGMSTYNERLARALQERGDQVTIYTFSLQYPGFLFPGKTQYSNEPPPSDLTIKVAVNSINPFNWIKVGLEIKKLKADIIIIRYWMPFMAPCLGTLARIIRHNKHSKVVAITDNIIPHEKMPAANLLSRYFVRSCDGFIAMSRAVLSDLEKFDKVKPRLFSPHPLYDNFGKAISKSQAKMRLGLEENTKYILFFGFIRDYKGLDLLIKAFADGRFRQLPVKLIIAGEFYIDGNPYLDMIESFGLKEQIVLRTEFIENDEIVNYFCASDIVAQPYKDATQSGVTQIAYHFDKPMLTTNVGGLSEMVPDGKVGYVVAPKVNEISEALLRFFIENREKEFAANVAMGKKRFSWEILLDRIDSIVDIHKQNNQ
ncbi:MAG: glycosyltransferase [Lentimicrobiaceae bacterium]|jgi:glycosyltransferase involved in cell wall biosynthesis